MNLSVGTDETTGRPVILDFNELVNKNGVIWGVSGSGKTTLIKGISRFYAKNNITSIIFDAQGDIFSENASFVSSVEISQATAYGLQPFVVYSDIKNGGVNNMIKNFLYAFNRVSSHSLGANQEATITDALITFMKEYGFTQEDPETWFNENYPTLEDFISFMERKKVELAMGIDKDTHRSLRDFIKSNKDLLQKKLSYNDQAEEVFNVEIEKVSENFKNFLYSLQGLEDLGSVYEIVNSKTKIGQIDGILNRLNVIKKKNIYGRKPIQFDDSKNIHRYDISNLEENERKIFIQLALKELYYKVSRKESKELKLLVWIDEAKNYIENANKEADMITKYYTEIRKYGVGIWLGAQRDEQLNKDIISNASTKFILGVDAMETKKLSKSLGIEDSLVKDIIMQESILLLISEKGKTQKQLKVNIRREKKEKTS